MHILLHHLKCTVLSPRRLLFLFFVSCRQHTRHTLPRPPSTISKDFTPLFLPREKGSLLEISGDRKHVTPGPVPPAGGYRLERGRVCHVCRLQKTRIRNSKRGSEERVALFNGVGTKRFTIQLGEIGKAPLKLVYTFVPPSCARLRVLDIDLGGDRPTTFKMHNPFSPSCVTSYFRFL